VTAQNTATRAPSLGRVADILTAHRGEILRAWIEVQPTHRSLSETELKSQCAEFLTLLIGAVVSGNESITSPPWEGTRELLTSVSRSRAHQGFSPSETATFVFSLKEPVFQQVRAAGGTDVAMVASDLWAITKLIDSLGLYTTEVYQRSREEVINRQQQDMLELSTPVVTLWDGILALPLIGTLDSARTQVVMETLLQRIVETRSTIAVIDITGVSTVDTLTAQHLLKTVTAARLMGAECIISGIRPQIAQTIVHLGVNLGDVITKASLADAFRVALARTGRTVTSTSAGDRTGAPHN
jgi:rsbT co-antagonist protein RsbR